MAFSGAPFAADMSEQRLKWDKWRDGVLVSAGSNRQISQAGNADGDTGAV